MSKYKVLALYGKSGSGKDTIQKILINEYSYGCAGIVSTTTRPPRDYEVEGKDYYFVKEEDFNKDLMLEWTSFNNWFYGTSLSSLKTNKINIGVFNLDGIKALQKNSEIDVLPIEISAPDKVRLERCLKREENPDCLEICRRFLADEEDFKNVNSKIIYINDSNTTDIGHELFSLSIVKEWIRS